MSEKLKPRLDAVGRKRLLKLAALLEADAKNKKGIRFDMSEWGKSDSKDYPISCGTQACAMGLAGLSGAFKAAGLTAELKQEKDFYFQDSSLPYIVNFKWKGRTVDGIEAAMKLFKMPMSHAYLLFSDWPHGLQAGSKAEIAMAKRLKDYAAGKAMKIINMMIFSDEVYEKY